MVQTISTQPWPEAKVGYEPDAATLTGDGHLLVTLAGANAVAVYRYRSPRDPVSDVGMIPTDYFPSGIATLGNTVLVTNMRGIDARRSATDAHGTHDTTASLTRFTLPSDGTIRAMTGTIFRNNGWAPGSVRYASSYRPARPVPVPVAIGDPSTIKYVFLIVKENRTCDQQFGDIASGNADPDFTQSGAAVTPNNHALVNQFGLYDNFYDAGTNSAEGRNWLMQADNPEYTQSLAGQYLRSYDTERRGDVSRAAMLITECLKEMPGHQAYPPAPICDAPFTGGGEGLPCRSVPEVMACARAWLAVPGSGW